MLYIDGTVNSDSRPKYQRFCDTLREIFGHSFTVVAVSVLTLVWRLVLSSPADPDLFARISMGRLVERLQGVPLSDPFAFTPKLPVWIDHEWLSGVAFYQIVSRCGDVGLILLKLAMGGWTALLLVRASMHYTPRASGRCLWAVVCLLEASYLWGSTIRCQVFTYFVVALVYYGFTQYRAYGARRYLALFPAASGVLANMHGGYALVMLVLLILTVCSVIERKPWRSLAVVTALSMLAPCATPYGGGQFIGYLIHALSMQRPTITEWAPLYADFGGLVRVALIATPVLVGVGIAVKRRTIDLTALVLLSFAVYCGVSHIRFVGFAMLTAVVFGARYVGEAIDLLRTRATDRMIVFERSLAFVSSVTLGVMVLQGGVRALQPRTWRLDTSAYPVAATKWLRDSGASGRLLVDFNNGSFAQWRLFPRFTVSLDGRYEEVYTNETVERVADAFMPHTPKGAAALRWAGPTHILFDASEESRKAQAALPHEWYEVYRDRAFSVFTNIENHPQTATFTTRGTLWAPLF